MDAVGAQLAWDNTQLQPIRPFGGVIDDPRVWSSPLIDADLAAEAGQWVEDFEAGDLTGWSCFRWRGSTGSMSSVARRSIGCASGSILRRRSERQPEPGDGRSDALKR